MMKCFDLATFHVADAGAAIIMANAAPTPAKTLIIPSLLSAPSLLAVSLDWLQVSHKKRLLKETIRIDIDADADLRAPLDAGQPVADHVLDIEASARVDQQALAVAAAKHGQRRRGGAKHDHSVHFWWGMTDS